MLSYAVSMAAMAWLRGDVGSMELMQASLSEQEGCSLPSFFGSAPLRPADGGHRPHTIERH